MVVLIFFAVALAAAAQTPRSVRNGVYTQEQANRGKAAYAEQRAACHGAALGGGHEAPALTGNTFLAHWHDHSVGDLFDSVRVSMPPDRPGSLSRQKNSDILAYILSVNKLPAGRAELSTQDDVLKQIT